MMALHRVFAPGTHRADVIISYANWSVPNQVNKRTRNIEKPGKILRTQDSLQLLCGLQVERNSQTPTQQLGTTDKWMVTLTTR